MTVIEGAEAAAPIPAIAAVLIIIAVRTEETGGEARIGNQVATHMIVQGGH